MFINDNVMSRYLLNSRKLVGKWFAGALLLFSWGHAEGSHLRVWAGGSDCRVEGRFCKELLGDVFVEDVDGEKHRIRFEQLSKGDLRYLEYYVPPEVEVDVEVTSQMLPVSEWSRSDDERELYTFSVIAKKKSRLPYKGRLTAELFVIGRDRVVKDDSRLVLMSYCSKGFELPDERKAECELSSISEVVFHSYLAEWVVASNDARTRGKEFFGWVLVIYDQTGAALSYKSDMRSGWLSEDIPSAVIGLKQLYEQHSGHYESRHFSRSFKKIDPPRIPWFRRSHFY